MSGDRMEMLQLTWPDTRGRWPGDPSSTVECQRQPRLDLLPAEQSDPGWRIYPWAFPAADLLAEAVVSKALLTGAPLITVTHDADGGWHLSAGGGPTESRPFDAMVALLPELRGLADLPPGATAEPDGRGGWLLR